MKFRRILCLWLVLMIALIPAGSGSGLQTAAPKTNASPAPAGTPARSAELADAAASKTASDDKLHAFVTKNAPSFGPLGSASEMEGTTLIITIMASDAVSSWNGVDETMERMLRYQKTAMSWLTSRCSEYGVTANFICDWKTYPDLLYQKTFTEELVRPDGSMYSVEKQYLIDEVPVTDLMAAYQADNVIFMFFFNTDYGTEARPWTLAYKDNDSNRICTYELMNIYVKFGDYETPPSTIAHETLHCFGAPDMYYANELITQEFVDYCAASYARDIMFTVTLGDTIIDEFTELDAYYVGLIDYSALVEEWGLGPSQHLGY